MVLVLLETQILPLNKVESATDRSHLGPRKMCTSNGFESQLQANGLNVCVCVCVCGMVCVCLCDACACGHPSP